MINKILKIKGVGRFKNFSGGNSDELKFFKNTIIFGYNTYGKSTLTTILRSLKTSNQKYIQGKKSFGYADKITVDILDDSNQHLTLSNGKWSNPNIVIFDNYFIHNSVYVGDEINHKHKSSLHGIFVGDDISQKVAKLKKFRGKKEQLEKQRDQIKLKYTKSNLDTFEGFLKAKAINGVKEKITMKEGELKILENLSSLKQLIDNSPLNSKFKKFSKSMQKTLNMSAEKNIENHVKAHWKNVDSSKNFLADGVALIKDKLETCVFCGQNLEPVIELISDFKKVFNSTYKETREEIERTGETFLRFNIEAEMARFLPLGIKCEEILHKKTLFTNKTNLDRDVRIKLKNLNHIIDCESEKESFKLFVNEVQKLHSVFEDIKAQSFSIKKQQILQKGIKKLQLAQYRYSSEGKKLVHNYRTALTAIEDQKTKIDDLRKKIDEETKNAMEKNHKQINFVLKDALKADFTIKELDSHSNLTRSDAHSVEYNFVMGKQVIPISNKQSENDEEPKDKPYFGNTLSDSDKRLLAMAFFISSLRTDENLKNKIVVLDDPFSSFDSNRKDYLAKAIIDIKNEKGEQPKQIIVLTHDDGFLGRLQKKLPTKNTKILKIKHTSAGGSLLDICNVLELIEEQYFQDIKYIKDSIDNSRNINESLGKVRKCLERVLRHKYYFSLDIETLENGSISSYLEVIGSKCKVKNEILESNWHEHMHDQHEIMKLSEPEKAQKLDDFLNLLEKI